MVYGPRKSRGAISSIKWPIMEESLKKKKYNPLGLHKNHRLIIFHNSAFERFNKQVF